MKKIFYLASIAALAFSSCTKDETTGAALQVTNGGIEIVASMESNDTRTQLVENEAGGFEIVWNGEDAIYVYENALNTENVPMKGTRFGLKGGADGTATGSFYYNANGGNVDKLSADQKYVAFYPAAPTTFALAWDGKVPYTTESESDYWFKNQVDLSKATMEIPAEQTYLPKSFAPGMVPAISKGFTVNEDGTATVEMQPMVDYLMVEVHATDDINKISLQLLEYKADKKEYYPLSIAGESDIKPYVLNGEVRYYLQPNNTNNVTINLNTGSLADNVSYKDANTYVFTVPAGILGMGKKITPIIWFNDEYEKPAASTSVEYSESDLKDLIDTKTVYPATNSKLNYDTATGYAHRGWSKTYNAAAVELENGIFWFNSVKSPVVYNPAGDFIIDSELKFFQYFSEYGDEIGNVNAYVQEDLELDLTADNMKAVLEAAVAADKLDDTSALAGVIHAYVESKGKFPTITKYESVFKGNGMSIVDIDRPLASQNGLFGEIVANAQVANINLSGLTAATYNESGDQNYNGENNEKDVLGYILAKKAVDGTDVLAIDNITVANLTADAVIGEGTQAQFTELAIAEDGVNESLEHMIASVNWNANYKFTDAAWAAMENLGGGVFHIINPVDGSDATPDHHVITLPEGAKYEGLTATVSIAKTAKTLSVLAGDVSYWTGGKLTPSTTLSTYYYPYSAPAGYDDYKAIQYAEELAALKSDNAYLVRNLDLNGSNGVNWTAVNMSTGELYGNGLTISNLGMEVEAQGEKKEVAPFTVAKISKLNVDGVNIVVNTKDDKNVNQFISGLASGVKDIYTVKLSNLNIEATADDNAVDYGKYNVFVGWFTAKAADGMTIVNSDVIDPVSTVYGYHGMVGQLSVNDKKADDQLEAIFQNSNVSGVTPTIEEFTEYSTTFKKGTQVASHVAVVSVLGSTIDLSFRSCGTPVFAYDFSQLNEAITDTSICVSYDYAEDVEVEISYNKNKVTIE